WDLLDHDAEETARDRAEGVRIAYVAATRARDLLVVPAIGDDPVVAGWEAAADSWVAPLHGAIYSPMDRRRAPAPPLSCPAFGEDSVMQRADQDTPGRDNMRPGLHVLGATGAEYGVTWWDPHVLELDVEPAFGIRRQDLIEDPGNDVLEADRRRYQEWQRTRDAALEQGA